MHLYETTGIVLFLGEHLEHGGRPLIFEEQVEEGEDETDGDQKVGEEAVATQFVSRVPGDTSF